ncbi:MAG: endonuclease MutS2 [Clostridia bacterium]|nr:endonuclease MutS2 [Clostridia bacterium]
MNLKTLNKLEFNKICDTLKSYSITYIGKEYSENLKPYSTKAEIVKAQKQTTEASTLLYRKGSIPVGEIENITPHIKKLNSGLFLNIKQLLDLTKILKISSNLKDYFFSTEIDMSEFINLENLFNNLYINPSIEKTISQSIVDENTLSDDASKELNVIRKSIRSKEQEIRNKLNSFLHSKYVQESVITVRSGRFVIPVKNEHRQDIKGFIHDISSSGSTVFVEPIAIFDLNNDLNNLKNEEQIEIEKILQKLTSLFFNIIPNMENNVNLIGLIDFIFAKAKYSNSLDATEPIINDEKVINLLRAWHPLLNKNQAVKNDIPIGKDYNCLIITGPNTGGKTVTLKTAGLLMLMAMSGLHITAKEGSSIYVADNIYADIGDDQSIADSLSTFSSHMTNIANILNDATENSFILIDELGSGTDPVEGSSLAISILEKLNSLKALTLSTTHYPEIKHFALVTDGFENASVEFNIETLSPTYKLLLGVPGTSNAFAISRKLGISEEIINRAKEFIDTNKINIEELLTNIYEDKRLIELEKEKTLKNSKEIENLKKSLEYDFSELNNKQKEIINKAKLEARDILLSAKEDANDIIKNLENSNSNKESNKLRNDLNKKIDDLSILKDKKENKKTLSTDDLSIGMNVYVSKIDQEGTILSISKDKKIGVQLALGKMFFDISDIEIKEKSNQKSNTKKDYSNRKEFKAKAISPEINLLGRNVDEACFEIDKFLDNCYLNGLESVRIVHGKGTGALRAGIHKFLKTHPHVKTFRVGLYGEGENGVTIVEIK